MWQFQFQQKTGSTICLITEFLGNFAQFINLTEDLIHIIHIYPASRKTSRGMESTLWSLRGLGVVSSGESLGIDRNRMEYALETNDKTWKWRLKNQHKWSKNSRFPHHDGNFSIFQSQFLGTKAIKHYSALSLQGLRLLLLAIFWIICMPISALLVTVTKILQVGNFWERNDREISGERVWTCTLQSFHLQWSHHSIKLAFWVQKGSMLGAGALLIVVVVQVDVSPYRTTTGSQLFVGYVSFPELAG